MTTRWSAVTVVSAATIAVLALAGCASETAGQPGPVSVPTSPGSQPGSSAGPSSAASGGADALAQFDPCHLVKKSEGAQFGITRVQPSNKYGHRACVYWGTMSFQVILIGTRGLAESQDALASGPPVKTTVDGHEAQLQRESDGACALSVSHTASSYFVVGGVDLGGDQNKACQSAQQAAPIVTKAIFGS